uniref:Uncharacterized protein n=1 Tax=Glossina palpalis gambiensis TaxID=67801 RepID=A0A1B0BWA4_9MUSC
MEELYMKNLASAIRQKRLNIKMNILSLIKELPNLNNTSIYARSNCVLEIRFGFRLILHLVEYVENAFSLQQFRAGLRGVGLFNREAINIAWLRISSLGIVDLIIVSDNTTGSTVCLLHQQLSPTGDKFTCGGSLVSGCLGVITLLSVQFEQ